MERTRNLPRGAVEARDLTALFERPGPSATVYLAVDSMVDDAASRNARG
jgi:hypothetical protein